MSKMKSPKFEIEVEDAKWWDDRKDKVEANLMAALERGETQRGPTLRWRANRLRRRGFRTKPTSSPCCTRNSGRGRCADGKATGSAGLVPSLDV